MTLLALKYRPQSFADLYGQVSARMILQSFVHSGDCPPAFLFTGPSGTGKTSAARVLAAALNCENPNNGDCCKVCFSCKSIQEGTSSSVHEIDAASNGGVDSIRELKSLSQFGTSSNWRVIILDEAHSMSNQAFNALLKTLEEPFSNTVFVLITTEPNKIISTVRSRAMPIEFKLLPPYAIFERLKFVSSSEGFKFSEYDLREVSINAEGSLRNALMVLDQASRSNMKIIVKPNTPLLILNALINQDLKLSHSLLTEYFNNNSDSSELISGIIDSLHSKFMAGQVNQSQLVQGMKLLWDARALNSSSRTTKSQLEALTVLIYSLFIKTSNEQKSILPIVEHSLTPVKKEISSMEELISLTEE